MRQIVGVFMEVNVKDLLTHTHTHTHTHRTERTLNGQYCRGEID